MGPAPVRHHRPPCQAASRALALDCTDLRKSSLAWGQAGQLSLPEGQRSYSYGVCNSLRARKPRARGAAGKQHRPSCPGSTAPSRPLASLNPEHSVCTMANRTHLAVALAALLLVASFASCSAKVGNCAAAQSQAAASGARSASRLCSGLAAVSRPSHAHVGVCTQRGLTRTAAEPALAGGSSCR